MDGDGVVLRIERDHLQQTSGSVRPDGEHPVVSSNSGQGDARRRSDVVVWHPVPTSGVRDATDDKISCRAVTVGDDARDSASQGCWSATGSEERLPGGRNSGSVRVGSTVRRATGDETPAVHALLSHLEAVGFDGAPRVLGIDERGREVLTYLEGETVGDQHPWPSWAHGDAALVSAGRWLRGFHDASRSFVPPPGSRWFTGRDDLHPGELVGHHDAAPYNAVWRRAPSTEDLDAGELVGFVDWDLAHPMPATHDLAFVALTWVPLTARDVAAADGFPASADRGRRLALLLDAYGWEASADEVLDAVRRRAVEHAEGLRAAAADGYGPAAALVAEGVADAFDRAAGELVSSREDLLSAFHAADPRW